MHLAEYAGVKKLASELISARSKIDRRYGIGPSSEKASVAPETAVLLNDDDFGDIGSDLVDIVVDMDTAEEVDCFRESLTGKTPNLAASDSSRL